MKEKWSTSTGAGEEMMSKRKGKYAVNQIMLL